MNRPILTQAECDDMDEIAEFGAANAAMLAALDLAARGTKSPADGDGCA